MFKRNLNTALKVTKVQFKKEKIQTAIASFITTTPGVSLVPI